MKMRPVGPLPIEPGKPVTFAAGGRRASPHARSVATEAVLGTLVVLTAGFLASRAPGTHEQPVWPFAWRLSVSAFYEPELRNENLGAARGRRRDDHGGQRRDVALA